MGIVLLILKIAGIILAAVLGILIAGLFCVLFVPVRYRGDFSVSDAEESDKKKAVLSLRAVWLLRFVRAYVTYEEAVRVQIKLLFFTVMDTAKEKKEKGREGKKKRQSEKDKKTAANADGGTDREKETEKAADDSPGISESTDETGRDAERPGGKEADERSSASKEKKGIKQRIDNILQTIRNFCDKLRMAREKTESFLEIWSGEPMVNSKSLVGRELRYLLKHSKPRKLKGYLRFGFDDPSTTGYALAFYYGLIYPIWCPKLSVEPDFERQILDCHLQIRGKIRAWHFLRSGCKLFFSKDIRRVLEDIRNL